MTENGEWEANARLAADAPPASGAGEDVCGKKSFYSQKILDFSPERGHMSSHDDTAAD
ncbi:MAG: hypothetical protein U1E16_04080 [Hyphomicrobiales bacterium]